MPMKPVFTYYEDVDVSVADFVSSSSLLLEPLDVGFGLTLYEECSVVSGVFDVFA